MVLVKIEPHLQQPITWEDFLPFGWHPMFYQMDKAEREPESTIEHSTDYLKNLWPALVLAVFFFIARGFCKKYIFNSLGRRFGIKSKTKLAKFGYQFWLAAAYTSSSIYGLYCFHDENWWTWPLSHASSISLWYPMESMDMIKPAMWFYYCWGTGFYTAELFAIFVETKRSDFLEYVIHHLVTITLLLVSTWSQNMRFGCLVLFLHDVTDIFLCVAKICHYLNKEFWVNVNFVLFLVSFAWLRLYCFPHLIDSTWFQAPVTRGFEYGFFICQSLLCVLLCLHCYWFVLVLKMVMRLLLGVKGDVRSEEEDAAAEAEARVAEAVGKDKKAESQQTNKNMREVVESNSGSSGVGQKASPKRRKN